MGVSSRREARRWPRRGRPFWVVFLFLFLFVDAKWKEWGDFWLGFRDDVDVISENTCTVMYYDVLYYL